MSSEKHIENIKEFKELYYEKGELVFLEIVLPYINRQKYVCLNSKGEIKKREINLTFSLLRKANDKNIDKILELIFHNFIWKKEKRNIKDMNRFSLESKKDLEEKLFKTIIKNNPEYSLKRAYELYLRDSESFFNVLSKLALIDDRFNKAFLLETIKELISKKEYNKNPNTLIYFITSFFAEEESSFYLYEDALNSFEEKRNNKEDLIIRLKDLEDRYKNKIELSVKLKSYIEILNDFLKKDEKFNKLALVDKLEKYLLKYEKSDLSFEFEEILL